MQMTHGPTCHLPGPTMDLGAPSLISRIPTLLGKFAGPALSGNLHLLKSPGQESINPVVIASR